MSAEPTLEDVARVAGVSRATASRVVRGAGPASRRARDSVARAIEELGYVPNQAARSLVTRQSDVIALIVAEPDQRIFTDPFFGEAIAGMAEALEATDKQLVLAMRTPHDGDRRLRRFIGRNQVDGVVVLSHHDSDEFADILTARSIPAAFVGRPLAPGMPYADLDNIEGGRLAARHILAAGASRPATISGPLDMPAAGDRLRGWREELAAAGVVEVTCYEGDFTPATGARLAERLLAEHPEVDSLFVASDLMAIAAQRVIQSTGRRVPDDIAVIGFDDILAARETSPSLSSVTNPARLLAREACRLVLSQIAGDEVVSPVIIEPQLVVRGSS